MSQIFDVSTVCNALVDIVIEAKETDLEALKLTKGIMHLVSSDTQKDVLKHLDGHDKTIELGGSALNAMRALALLGKNTSFTGRVGDDKFGKMIEDRMQKLSIKPNLAIAPDSTGTCVILVTPDGERTMVTCLGASRLYNKSDLPTQDIAQSKIFHFCGYQWDTDDQKEAINAAIDVAKSNGALISFDIADPFVVNNHRDDFIKIVEDKADIVFANEEESKLLYQGSPDEAAAKITESGAIAVIKLGSKGAFVKKGSDRYDIAPVLTQVLDTTAAGDMFAAGFLYGLSSDQTLDRSGHFAATLASDVISRYGATLSDAAIKNVRIDA